MRLAILAFAAFLSPLSLAFAQAPSSTLLLGPERDPVDDAVESTRYKTRPKASGEQASSAQPAPSPSAPSASVPRRRASAPIVVRIPPPIEAEAAFARDGAKPAAPDASRDAESEAPEIAAAEAASGSPQDAPSRRDLRRPPEGRPSVEARPSREGRRAEAPGAEEDDRRQNLLEIEVAPFFVYDGSDSAAAHRRYSTSGSGLGAAGRVWLTPTFGAQARFASTFGGSVSDSLVNGNRVGADHEWVQAGIRTRRFFSASSRASSLSFGIDYWSYEHNVPQEAQLRQKIKTSGAALSLEGDLPTSESYAWTFRLQAVPRARHEESSSQTALRSGGSPETYVLDFGLGGRVSFDRSNEAFWRLSHRIEQNRFSGPSTAADPVTGAVLRGVTVTNSFTFFEFGYSWGN